MTEDFKKQLCELAGIDNADKVNDIDMLMHNYGILKILIKAMWAINRESLKMDKGFCIIMLGVSFYVMSLFNTHMKHFDFKDYNNSEQQALQAALEYILEQEKK